VEETIMKTMLNIAVFVGLFGLAGTGFTVAAVNPNALEPCINGLVSASGLYPTQAEEDAAFLEANRLEQPSNVQLSESVH
jgi:hypothetical protein